MNKLVLLSITLIGFSFSSFSQTKKVKIKKDKSASYYYNVDSSCVDIQTSKAIILGFHQFFKAVEADDYTAFQNCLSPTTKKLIVAEKLQRKFKKFKVYAVKLMGKVGIKSITKYTDETQETEQVYICTAYLPDGQTIGHRVGFDPLKRNEDPSANTWIGLHLVSTEEGFKAVILW